jgi:hypothetical protein
MPNYVQSPPYPKGLMRGFLGYSFGALTQITIAASPGGLVRAAGGIVTLTTTGAHNFAVGQILTIAFETSVGGTRFAGNYIISTIPSGTTATLTPVDPVVLHQAPDTGGAGTATSIAFETPAAPQAGQAFALADSPKLGSQSGFYVDGIFSAAPGAFEVDIQVCQVEAPQNYQTMANGNVTTVDATNNTFHFDATWTGALFVRLRILSRTNAVGFIGTIRT